MSGTATATMLAKKTAQRELKRKRMKGLFEEQKKIQKQMKDLEDDLYQLDEEIDVLERQVSQEKANDSNSSNNNHRNVGSDSRRISFCADQNDADSVHFPNGMTQTQNVDENLTEPLNLTINPDEILTEPTQWEADDKNDITELPSTMHPSYSRTRASVSSAASTVPSRLSDQSNADIADIYLSSTTKLQALPAAATAHFATRNVKNGTLDSFIRNSITPPPVADETNNQVQDSTIYNPSQHSAQAPIFLPQNQHAAMMAQRPSRHDRNAQYLQQLLSDNFPWSQEVYNLLHNAFHIPSFRDHQKEIINCTLSGDDVFVIMRTGGGKSLTYQLPALLEGRGPQHKVTIVISPLLSLIQDQEDQMNEFAPGSALSFCSNLAGGQTEHARRWGLVRDPTAGVCLIFVTPEKVHKSGKFRNEMEKLHEQGRLGRFVIDECHCACQWGHDFRPDYTKLNILKAHFPTTPMMAVTATASDRVRQDCCQLLGLGTNYQFFRSSSNRPNLKYSVVPKTEGKDSIIDNMAAFIKENHPRDAGIIYAYSKNDADTVADKLCERGIVAQSYHSMITPKTKENIHKSWMRNDTQVVVATIAFGLGINKPDVRFVLHHTLSKTLEAYYQESGRAGRDGSPADCVLYYSAKDVPRMIRMVHGESSEGLFWNMVRYAQESGNDAVCKAITLRCLGELPEEQYKIILAQNEGLSTDRRDVGVHAKTVVALLQAKLSAGEDMTLSKLVKEWRMKPDKAAACVRANPPGKEFTTEECERIVIALLLEDILGYHVIWNAYDSVVYLKLGSRGNQLLASPNPKVIIPFPKRTTKPATRGGSTEARARKTVAKDDGWIQTKSKAERKQLVKSTTKARKTRSKSCPPMSKNGSMRKSISSEVSNAEVIDLLDVDENSIDEALVNLNTGASHRTRKRKRSNSGNEGDDDDDDLWDDPEESEYEFEG